MRRLVAFGTALSTIGAAGWLGFGTAAADEPGPAPVPPPGPAAAAGGAAVGV